MSTDSRHQPRTVPAILLLATSVVSTGCLGDIFGNDDRVVTDNPFEVLVDVTTQTNLQLEAINGSITVTGEAGRSTVLVAGIREVQADNLEEAEAGLELLDVVVSELQDAIRVRTIQPEEPDGRSYIVNYEITVPDDLVVVITNANGVIEVSSINNTVDIVNANGDIVLEDIFGSTLVELGNGGVEAEVALPAGGMITIAVGNGGIGLSLPLSTSAEFSASVGNGSIVVLDLDLQNMTTTTGSVTGILGGGDGLITLAVGNGGITVIGF